VNLVSACLRGHTSGRYKSGHCKECNKANYLAWKQANPEKDKAYQEAWRARNPEKVRAKSREWRAANLDKARVNSREYQRRALPEPTRPCPDACEICGSKPNRALSLDHCHATNTFRGWLCSKCNSAIAFLKDSPELCMAAAKYLNKGSH
jgi:hypothetical protein